MKSLLCSIPTRGRYDTTLSMSIQAVINQTKKIDHLVIFDDNDEEKVKDLREIQVYKYLFHIMDLKGISWSVVYGQRKGQHYNHQIANTMGYEWVWRVDDDCIPEPNVLETLCNHITSTVGSVGGSILTPPFAPVENSTGRIEDIYEPSIQWDFIKEKREVDHLHCSFIYRAGIVDYNLSLSRVAFREETLFTYGLKQRGYQNFVVPGAITWHLRNQYGGVRTETKELFEHDDWIFHNYIKYRDHTIVVLDCGLGDHLVFKKVLPEIKNPLVFSCYPDVVPGESIGEAQRLFGDLSGFNIYGKMDQWKWRDSLESAFRKMYVWEMP